MDSVHFAEEIERGLGARLAFACHDLQSSALVGHRAADGGPTNRTGSG